MSLKSTNKLPKSTKIDTSITTSKAKGGVKGVVTLAKVFGSAIVLAAFIISGLFVYVIVERDSSFSKWVDNSSPLSNYFSLNNDETQNNIQTNAEIQAQPDPNTVNQILGLDVQEGTTGLAFAKPENNLTITKTIEKVLPSVISIRVSQSTSNSPFGPQTAGSGYFVSEDGLIITNKHVVGLACNQPNGAITITGLTQDQKAYDLELLSVDPIEDIAILRANKNAPEDTFPSIEIADSRELQLGTEVIAIGNTLGQLQNTVTTGIVSGLDRSLSPEGFPADECTGGATVPESLIQTDAAISQGNSGGPLFNSSGQLIGMNTYGIPSGQNIGLAIPSVRIQAALQSYNKNDKIVRPRLGIYSRPITPVDEKEYKWLPVDYGEFIFADRANTSAVDPESAAAKAGLKEGDIILEVNGNKLQATTNEPTPLRSAILNLQAQDNIGLTVLKSKGNENGVFTYEENPTQINVTLGGTSFDLKK
jgi:S1-C subfamily serine protease